MSFCVRLRPIVAAAVLMLLADPSAVYASYTSTLSGSTAIIVGDFAGDTLVIIDSGGNFAHNRFPADAGFNSTFDFDSTVPGDQMLSSSTGIININAGEGDDVIILGNGVNLRGAVDGGPGVDRLDYSAFAGAVVVDLGLGTTGLRAALGGDQ